MTPETVQPISADPAQTHSKPSRGVTLARLIAGVILGQTLFFKFSAAPESVYIFEQLGVEPWGRLGSGVVEGFAVLFLLAPLGNRWLAIGGLLTLGVMAGAVGSHLALLGIEVQGDGGTLFGMALATLGCGAYITWTQRRFLPFLGS